MSAETGEVFEVVQVTTIVGVARSWMTRGQLEGVRMQGSARGRAVEATHEGLKLLLQERT
ncbi:hypothetical protein HK414_24020 [Ramlibacter terrae]|uniref:Uncharacterized protein n=1 Tax=Ramlibacter terrae TaxID=2732511 RepID=A0ABX6P5G8_9BURK|nr:hypothetical protein HK414_24020 [Ramlibacter terrae]